MKNPFLTNFIWIGGIMAFTFILLFGKCFCGCGLTLFQFSVKLEGVLIGIFSSAFLLFLTEMILYLRDRKRYSFLAGHYRRISIYQINQDRKQAMIDEIKTSESGVRFEYTANSIYHRLQTNWSNMENFPRTK